MDSDALNNQYLINLEATKSPVCHAEHQEIQASCLIFA